jgi:hypothetical protein
MSSDATLCELGRVHIDIETDDIPAEVARLETLGARVVERRQLLALTLRKRGSSEPHWKLTRPLTAPSYAMDL